ncbi:MAG: SAM-dependent methyltransferase [Clostridia bacterium]|nr:SAM-dependent methyltransferase [Clostridia bacterium]
MISLPNEFKIRMKELLGTEYDDFIAAYEMPPARGLRVNTLKTSIDAFLSLTDVKEWNLMPSSAMKEGFIIKSQKGEGIAGKHPYHLAGAYYMQEPSAMSVAAETADYDFSDETLVLDMCAAPGGKSGAVAAQMQGKGVLVSNEIVHKRAEELSRNMERLGVTNAVVTCASPEKIAERFCGRFDIVFVDAPCSGEGMFRKNPESVCEWSVEHVGACANRQKLIMKSASMCVKAGGLMIYSTCTFSREENEQVVEEFISESGFEVLKMKRLFPHSCDGEGHFLCVMKAPVCGDFTESRRKKSVQRSAFNRCDEKIYDEFLQDTFAVLPNMQAYMNDTGKVILANDTMMEFASDLPCVSCGVHGGYVKKGYFEPAQGIFTASHGGRIKRIYDFSPESPELIRFLHGESPCESKPGERGYCLISCDGFPMGFCKASEGVLKNKLPKGLRVK